MLIIRAILAAAILYSSVASAERSESLCAIGDNSGIRPNKSIRLGGYFYTGRIDIPWYARNFDLLDLNAKNAPGVIDALKEVNPKMVVFQQFLANQIAIKEMGAQAVEGYRFEDMSGWLLRKNSGETARSHRGPYYLLMDHGRETGWAGHFSDYVGQVIRRTKADGVVLDEVPLSLDVPFSELQKYPDRQSIQAATTHFLGAIQKQIEKPVLINAGQLHHLGSSGKMLWETIGPLIDGAWHEGWVRYYLAHNHPHTGDVWEADIRSAEHFSRLNKYYIASPAFQDRSELEYAIANYLLAKNSDSLVFQPMYKYDRESRGGFNFSIAMDVVEKNRDLFDVEMGCPLESRVKNANAWTRRYDNGVVVVNPTASDVNIRLEGRFVDMNGSSVGDRLALKPFQGVLLKNAPR